jgi:hypothetical protein
VRLRFQPRADRQARVEELRDAAAACGIELPLRPGRGCDGAMEGGRERSDSEAQTSALLPAA